jgi:hypothetical protein
LADVKISEATLLDSGAFLEGTDRFPLARQGSTTAFSTDLSFLYVTMMDWLDGIADNPLDGTAGNQPTPIFLQSGTAFAASKDQGGGATLQAGDGDGDGTGGNVAITAGAAGSDPSATGGSIAIRDGVASGTAQSVILFPGGQPTGVTAENFQISAGSAKSATGNDGTTLLISAGASDGDGEGGTLGLYAGNAGGEQAAGIVDIQDGTGAGTASSQISLPGGQPVGDATPVLAIRGGKAQGVSGNAGTSIEIVAGNGDGAGVGGHLTLQAGIGATAGTIIFDGAISAAGGDYVTANSGTLPDMAHQTIVVTDATNLPGQSYSLTLGKLYADFFGEWYFNNPMDAASGSGDNGMGVYIDAGVGDGAGEGGRIQLTTGGTTGSGNSGPIFFRTAYPLDTAANSGQIGIATGGANAGNSGAINIATGDTSSNGSSGFIDVKTGASSTGDSSRLQLRTGEAGTNSGQINILSGNAQAVAGDIQIVAGDSGPDFQGGGMYVLAGNGDGSGQGGFTQVSAGTGGDTGNGGNIQLSSGTGGSTSGNGGNVTLASGSSGATSGDSGTVTINSGDAPAGDSGNITLQTGTASGTRGKVSAVAREISLVADEKIILDAGYLICPVGNNFLELGTEGTGGVDVFTGSLTGNQVSGGANFSTGNTENAHTGGMQIFTGSASGDGYNSGSIGIFTGNPGVGGTRGSIVLDALRVLLLNAPTSDPHVAGALWVDTSAGRVVKCSAG